MSGTGKAAVFLGPGKGYEIQEFDIPTPEPGGIVIKVAMGGICGSDLHIWRGDSPVFAMMAGNVAGHEMTGRVHSLGSDVKTDSLGRPLKEGDRVAYAYFYPCNRCYQCNRGEFSACPNKLLTMGPGAVSKFSGAYGEYYYLKPGGWIFKIPDEVTDEMATPVNCALSQVTYGLAKAGLRYGDTLVVQGAGGLGLNAIAVAKEMGADAVIAIDGIPSRLELATRFGADAVIDINEHPTPMDRITKVKQLTQNRGADIVAEFVGVPAVVPEGLQMLRDGGTYLEIGNISMGRTTEIDPSQLVWGTKRIQGVIMYDPWVIPEALDFLVRTREKYPHGDVVSHKFKLEDINNAFENSEWAREGQATKVNRAVIVP
ncbi:MAG TPA: zinc-binding dehydrogenase [Dehalococcoidia bacterium]|jgi:D-arabinose 1-dehydrogenase-like Zn-dependent alcohol dehydrogenase|nr:zinc-binding dehydrogenase [Dehalococcoidia bacterium]